MYFNTGQPCVLHTSLPQNIHLQMYLSQTQNKMLTFAQVGEQANLGQSCLQVGKYRDGYFVHCINMPLIKVFSTATCKH